MHMRHYRQLTQEERYQITAQIAGSLGEAGYPLVSHEWIYRHIERDQKTGGDLHKHLRQRRKRYRKRYGSQEPSMSSAS